MNALVFVFAASAATCYGATSHTFLANTLFFAMDSNFNQQITPAEMTSLFSDLATSAHGMVSRHDFTEFVCGHFPDVYNLSHYLYDKMDTDGNHHLEPHDYDNLFAKVDTDTNGVVTRTELDTFFGDTFNQHGNSGTHHQTHAHGHSACH